MWYHWVLGQLLPTQMEITNMDLATRVGTAIEAKEALACAATPGPWCEFIGNSIVGVEQAGIDDGHLVAEMQLCPEVGHKDRRVEDAAFIADNNPEIVLRRCAADKHTLVRCQEALLASSPMLVHFAKMTLEEMAERYGVKEGARR